MSDDANKPVLDAIAALRAEMHASASAMRAEVHAGHVAIMDRIDGLQGAVEQLRADSMVNWATADTALRRARGNQDEAREVYDLITAMQRQIRLLEARVDGMQGRGTGAG